MLIGLHPLLTPDLLHALAAMGHGDTIALVDANYPATRGRRLIPLAGAGVAEALEAVLTLLPLDSFVDNPAMVMEVVGESGTVPPAEVDINAVLRAHGAKPARAMERFAFYDTANAAYAIVHTGERRFYGNVILTKGVIPPEK
jgi:L-fucose mutarotase